MSSVSLAAAGVPGHVPVTRRAIGASLDLGLCHGTDVHRTGIRARDISQSNGVAMVECGAQRWVAKDTGHDSPEGSWRREAAVYRQASAREERLPLPDLLGESETHAVMLIEALGDGWVRLDECDLRSKWSVEVVASFGRTLARWYDSSKGFVGIEPSRPWLLEALHGQRLPVFERVSAMADLLDRVLAEPALAGCLDRVDAAWSPSSLMHGDIRYTNVFFHVNGSVRLIDWETAGWGDPRWDIAGMVQELRSVTIQTGIDTARHEQALLAGAPHPGIDDFVAARLLLRAIQLESWPEGTTELVDAHLEAARVAAAATALVAT